MKETPLILAIAGISILGVQWLYFETRRDNVESGLTSGRI
jgi:hypothetical protein